MRSAVSSPKTSSVSQAGASPRAPVALASRLISQPIVIALLLAADLLAIIVLGALAHAHWYEAANVWFVGALGVAAATTALILKSRWVYTIPALANPANQIAHVAVALVVALCCLVVGGVFAGADIAPLRGWISQFTCREMQPFNCFRFAPICGNPINHPSSGYQMI